MRNQSEEYESTSYTGWRPISQIKYYTEEGQHVAWHAIVQIQDMASDDIDGICPESKTEEKIA